MLSQSEYWWCTEYADEIHDVLQKRECDRFYFEYKAPQIKWRMHLLSFMLDMAEIQNLGAETFHLAVYFMDIFLDNHIIRLWRLKLVGLVALRIAAKIEEKDFAIQRIEALNTCANYAKDDYNILESIMLKMFDWDINVPTASTFGVYYAEFVVDETDFNNNHGPYDSFHEFKEDVKSEVFNLIDTTLFDLSLQHDIAPSKLAAMCLAAIRNQRNIEPIWPLTLIKLTRYTWDNMKPDFEKLFNILVIPHEQLSVELEEGISQETPEIDETKMLQFQ